MGIPNAQINPSPALPVPNRADSLWRGCQFAVNCGWDKGFRQVSGPESTPETLSKRRGNVDGSLAGTVGLDVGGRNLNTGASDDGIEYDQGPAGQYEPNNGNCALFWLGSIETPTEFGNNFLVGTKTNTGNQDGIALTQNNDVWRFEISNGATELEIDGNTLPVSDQRYRVCGNYAREGPDGQLWVDGIREATSTTVKVAGDGDGSMQLFWYKSTSGPNQDRVTANVALMWNRPLAQSEIQRLYVDPYRMWRPLHREFMMGPAGVAAGELRGWRVKPALPFLNRADSMTRSLLFASEIGWNKGFIPGEGQFGPWDDVNRRRCNLDNANTDADYMVGAPGRGLRNNAGDFLRCRWPDIENRYDFTESFTAAIIAKPAVGDQPGSAAAFGKRDDNTGVGGGWAIETQSSPSPDRWLGVIWDGVSANSVTVTPDFSTSRVDSVVLRYNRNAGVAEMFINGKLAGSLSLSTAIPQNNDELFAFGFPALDDKFEGELYVAAHWSRALSAQEIQRFNADPHLMWRQVHKDFMFGVGLGEGASQTYFLAF